MTYNKKVEYIREIDFDEYKSFFLEYYTDGSRHHLYHGLRPCKLSYDEVKKSKSFVLDSVVMTFSCDMSIQEILVQCTISGVHVDYIDMYEYDVISSKDKFIRSVDCHENEIFDIMTEVNSLKFYTVKNNDNKQKNFKFLVIDRFKQSAEVKFLNGEYDENAIIAGFKKRKDAEEFCLKKNRQYL